MENNKKLLGMIKRLIVECEKWGVNTSVADGTSLLKHIEIWEFIDTIHINGNDIINPLKITKHFETSSYQQNVEKFEGQGDD